MKILISKMKRQGMLAFSILVIGFSPLYAQFAMPGTLHPPAGYPIVVSNEIQGGVHVVATYADLANMPISLQQEGMLCYVQGDKTYQLLNNNWVVFSAGAAASAVISDDNSNTNPVFPTWVTASTGGLAQYVSSTKLSFIPSTGVLTASGINTTGIVLNGSSNGTTTLSSANTSVTSYSISFPAKAGTVALTSDIPFGSGTLYQGAVDDLTAFNGLLWSDIQAGTNLGTSFPATAAICTMDAAKYTWIAFPKIWGSQNFFYRYGTTPVNYIVLDGIEKRLLATTDVKPIDYQIWLFEIKPGTTPVSLTAYNF